MKKLINSIFWQSLEQFGKFKVNRQSPKFVMQRPELKIPTLAKLLISPLECVIIKICKSTLRSRPTATLIFIMKHEFLYNNYCKPVCKLLSVFQKCLISCLWRIAHQLTKYGAYNLLVGFAFRLTEIFWRASLMQEKSQSSDFASSTGTTAKICNMFCDQLVQNRFCL